MKGQENHNQGNHLPKGGTYRVRDIYGSDIHRSRTAVHLQCLRHLEPHNRIHCRRPALPLRNMAGLQAIHRIQLTKEYKNTDENKAIGYLRSRDNNVGGCRSTSSPIKKGEYAKGSATVYCDEGFKTILDEEIQVFEFSYPEASIIPFYVSEQEAIDKFLADKTQAIIVTRELTKDQIKYMKSKFKRVVRTNCIAVDAVALITNKENPVDRLSLQEIGDILSGKISRWSQLA